MGRFWCTSVAKLFFVVFSVVVNAEDVVPTSDEQTGVSSESDGRWIINHPDSRRIYAVQCGLDVTLFALKYYKIDYSLVRVSLGLPLTTDGISLADIQQMLQVYGLEAEARKGVTIKQIANRLSGEYIAIIPLGMGGGRNHYYIGAMDDKGVVQLVNVSKGVSPLVRPDPPEYNSRIEQRFAEAGIEFYAWDFEYNEKKGFLPFTVIDKSGKQTHTFKAGVHVIAVKVVDNEGLESVETIKLKVNGVVKKV